MSEAELHILKARMLEARMAKARRGELGKPVPMGYIRRPSGEIILDPDEQAQATIRLAFELYQRFGTIGKRYCAISPSTRSACQCAPPVARTRASLSGAGPTGHLCILYWSTQSTPAPTFMACVRPIGGVISRVIQSPGGNRPNSTMRPSSFQITCRPTSLGISIRKTRLGYGPTQPD